MRLGRLPVHPLPRLWWGAVLWYSTWSLLLFSLLWYQTDTPSYTNAIHLLAGESAAPDRLFRLSKPLALLFPTLLYQTLGLAPAWGLLLQQYLAYWLGAWALFQWLCHIFEDRQAALYGLLVYLGLQPLAVYGLAMLTDGLGWCLLLWGLYLGQVVLWQARWQFSTLLGLGLYWGLACFVKESILVAGLWGAGLILLRPNWSLLQKMGAYVLLGTVFGLVLILGNVWTTWMWEVSLWSWIQFGRTAPPAFSWWGLLAQAYHTLDGFWWLVVLGSTQLWRYRDQQLLWASAGTAALGGLLFPWVWPYGYDRILLMLVPLALPLMVVGARLLQPWTLPLLLLGGAAHLLMTYLIYAHQIGGLLVPYGIGYGLLLLWTLWKHRQKT